MCGRFSLDRKAETLEARFKARLRIETYTPLFNIAPTGPAALIPQDDAEGIQLASWGLTENAGAGRTMINARTETLLQKWPFRNLVKDRRCLVLASGYIEWKALGTQKIPYLHTLTGGGLFAMAGLYEDSENIGNGQKTRRFTILTRPSGPITSQLHDRMPVILPMEAESDWLKSKHPDELVQEFLKAAEPGIDMHPISTRINKSFANDPSLLKETPEPINPQLSLF